MKTLEQKLHSKSIKKPNWIIYNFLGRLWQFTVARKYKLKTTFIDDPKKEKGSYILLSNHASRMDYIFTAIPLLPHTFNFVVGYNEFFRSHLHGIFSLMHEIPKKNFTPDLYAIMEMKRVINNGGRLTLFPEGMSSISGGSQPVALGTAKLLKFLKVPVYLSNIKGAYLVSPKFNLKERKGPVEVSFKKLFYKLVPIKESKAFNTPKEWFDYQRQCVKEEIKDSNFELKEEVDIGFLPKYEYLKHQKTSEIEGKGILKINHEGIFFDGTRNGKPFSFTLSLKETPTYGMCTDASRFYTFLKGEFIEFYPKRKSVIKWLLVTEELHRLHGGLWKDYDFYAK